MDNKDRIELISELRIINKSIEKIIYILERSTEQTVSEKKATKKKSDESAFSNDELQHEWRKIQKEYIRGKGSGTFIDEFVNSNSKKYLVAFVKANNLPIQTKDSKLLITEHLKKLLMVGSTITGN